MEKGLKSSSFLSFITLFEITESTCIIQSAHIFSKSNDTTNALDGNHQRRVCQHNATRLTLEKRKQPLLSPTR